MTTNLSFLMYNNCEPTVVLEFYCPFFPNILGCWRAKFSNFNSFHNRVEFGTILEGLRNFGGRFEHPNSPPPPGTPLAFIFALVSSRVKNIILDQLALFFFFF